MRKILKVSLKVKRNTNSAIIFSVASTSCNEKGHCNTEAIATRFMERDEAHRSIMYGYE